MAKRWRIAPGCDVHSMRGAVNTLRMLEAKRKRYASLREYFELMDLFQWMDEGCPARDYSDPTIPYPREFYEHIEDNIDLIMNSPD